VRKETAVRKKERKEKKEKRKKRNDFFSLSHKMLLLLCAIGFAILYEEQSSQLSEMRFGGWRLGSGENEFDVFDM
jgi:hypothetical protein